MHEWYITEELLDTVCTQAKENRISKITKIQVDLGVDQPTRMAVLARRPEANNSP